ncbi:MAG: DUF2510 domain-containing protein [Propionibacteriaceae bacterium]
MAIPPPGWYADPAGSEQYRWWDGVTWTDALSVSQRSQPPHDAVAAGPAPVVDLATDQLSREPDRSPRFEATSASTAEFLDASPRTHQRSVRRPLAVVVVLTLICVTGLGLGTSLFGSDRDARTSPNRQPAAAQTPTPSTTSTTAPSLSPNVAPPGWVDQATGEARIGAASMTLPGEPYQVSPDSFQNSVVDAAFSASAPVHPAYRGSPSWFATVAMLHVPADQVAANPEATGQKAMRTTLRWFFGSTELGIKNEQVAQLTVDQDRPALQVTAEIWYAIDGLPSTHDDLTFVITALPDGSCVAAVSSVPNDAPAEQRTLAATSLASLTVG